MPLLTEYAVDIETLPHSFINVAPADVAIGVIGTYADAATLGTLQPGVYQISANVFIANGAVAAAFFNTKIMVGAVAYAPTEGSCIISGEVSLATPSFVINVPVAAVVKVQATGTQLGTIKYIGLNGGTLPGATYISALRIK